LLIVAVALASKASIHGYRVIAVVPETTSFGRIQLIKAMGAEIVRTPAGVRSDSDESQYAVARRIASGIDGAIVIDEASFFEDNLFVSNLVSWLVYINI
jgi:cysteine synthase